MFTKCHLVVRPGEFGIAGESADFTGCMKDVVIGGKPVVPDVSRAIGDVQLDTCKNFKSQTGVA